MENRIVDAIEFEEPGGDVSLRPAAFEEYIGQGRVKENLRIFVEAARRRGEALDHVLLSGPPGLGKTTLAHIIAQELGSRLHVTSGPALEKKGDLAGILTNLEEHDVLFIDEIHRLSAVVEENLYPAMEDGRFDVVVGDGVYARSVPIELRPFTLVGATTRSGLLTSPMRDRFGVVEHLEFYTPDELAQIVTRSATDGCSARRIADHRWPVCGTPRITNRLPTRRYRESLTALSLNQSLKTPSSSWTSISWFRSHGSSFDAHMIDKFDGGPVGLDTIAAAIGEEKQTVKMSMNRIYWKEGYIKQRGRLIQARLYTLWAPRCRQESFL